MLPIRDVNPTRITPIATIAVILVNVWVFLFWQPAGGEQEQLEFLYTNAVVACEISTGDPLTPDEINRDVCLDGTQGTAFAPDKNVWLAGIVSIFLHGSIGHLLGNMWFLWIFGNNVEEAYGTVFYLMLFLVAGVAATAGFVFANPEATEPLVGASGAIAGVLGAYMVLFPTHQILSLFVLWFVPIPAIIFLGLWFLGQFGIQDAGVAWEAHVAGFVTGILITLPLRSVLLARVRRLQATAPDRFMTA